MSENQLVVIENELNSKSTMRNLMLALGAENSEDRAKANDARRHIASALAEIQRSEGAEFGDLTVCSPPSVIQAVTDAAKFRIMLDGRKLAHLEVRYNKARKCNEALLQIDTNGYVAKIAEAYPDVDYSTSTVFEGDQLTITEADSKKDYILTKNNPFCSDVSKLQGIVVRISYTDNGRLIQHVDTVSAADLAEMKKMGKGNAWKNWTIERMRTAALKRCCKWHFRKLSMLQDMIEYDNRQNYDLNQDTPSITPSAGTVIDNLNKAMEQEKPSPSVHDAEIVKDEHPEAPCPACDGKGSTPWQDETGEGTEPCKPCKGTGKAPP